MKFIPLALVGAFLIELEPFRDERGAFCRTFCSEEFSQAGLPASYPQASLSQNIEPGTLRGMHLQIAPHDEDKLIRVSKGAIFDAAVDLRPDSPTYLQQLHVKLTAGNPNQLFLPKGLLHGFQTLEPDTHVFYQMSEPYHPSSSRVFCWNDPQFGIPWPLPNPILNLRDANAPVFDHAAWLAELGL